MTPNLKVPAEDIKGIQTKPLTGGCTGPVLHRIFIETTNPKNPVPKSLIAKYCEISKLPPRDMSERFFSFLQAPDKFCRKEGEAPLEKSFSQFPSDFLPRDAKSTC